MSAINSISDKEFPDRVDLALLTSFVCPPFFSKEAFSSTGFIFDKAFDMLLENLPGALRILAFKYTPSPTEIMFSIIERFKIDLWLFISGKIFSILRSISFVISSCLAALVSAINFDLLLGHINAISDPS